MSHVHESPQVMLVPLYLLAAGALAAGFVFNDYFIGHDEALSGAGALPVPLRTRSSRRCTTFRPGSSGRPSSPWCWASRSPICSISAAPIFRASSPRSTEPLYQFLLNKWYFDELYDFIFVRPAMWLGRFLWKTGDGWLIDGFGPDGVSARVIDVTKRVVRLQTGYLYHYAFAMLIGVAALVTWFMFGGAH